MKYSKSGTLAFAKSIDKEECLKFIGSLVVNEGYTGDIIDFNGDEFILDMDCVEHKLASYEKRCPNKSMDSAFIIEGVGCITQEIVFIEYRFNYENLKNLNRISMLDKVLGSASALGNPPNINGTFYYVFESKLKNQAINRINRMNPAMPQQYIAVDMDDIKTFFR